MTAYSALMRNGLSIIAAPPMGLRNARCYGKGFGRIVGRKAECCFSLRAESIRGAFFDSPCPPPVPMAGLPPLAGSGIATPEAAPAPPCL
ncbi:MAG: hypothetical protein GDA53_06490 [Rhodobacteraceae bacterium]|nr:hypothetical protein [Paracoccaceae bacterium]